MIQKIFLEGGKKFIIIFSLIFLLISQTNIWVLYAQGVNQLEATKDASIEVLDKTEAVVDVVIEKLDEQIHDEREQKLEKKAEEIEEYIEEIQEQIENENSISDMKEIVAEAKKVVVLKVVAGATKTEDIEESISSEVADTAWEKAEAVETMQESLETNSGDYSIIMKTSYDRSTLKELFDKFDSDIQIDFLYDAEDQNYYEVFIDEDSIFRQEMLEDIEAGILPENFFGVEIVFPEVFSIWNLEGEDLTQTWWIEEYKTYEYLGTSTNAEIKVWVVDTGIDYTHPDLSANVSGGYDFVNDDSDAWDDQWHGTHVAGTIAASINGSGIIWVNPHADLVPLKICNASGFCPSYAVIRALDYATEQDIDILNMSLGGRWSVADHPICAGISSYTDAGWIVVSASGNSNIDTSQFIPGWCADAITVWAYDRNGQRASFSNYGPKVDVAAPWVSVYSTYPTDKWNYRSLSGTSMATPHIAGLVSLIQSEDESITTSELKALLKQYPISVGTTSGKTIASAVDIAGVMSALSWEVADTTPHPNPLLPGEETAIETEDEEVENEDNQGEGIAIIDDSIDFETIPEIQQINLNPEGVEINNQEDTSEPILLEEVIESSQEISFEGLIAPEPWSVEINSENLPEIEITDVSPDAFDTTSIKEFFIESEDGTIVNKSDVQINSIEDSEEELVELDLDIYTWTWFVDEITEIDFTDGESLQINSNEPLEPTEEELEVSSDIEINSLDEEGFEPTQEISEFQELATLEPIILPGIWWESGVEINSLWDEELKEIEEIVVWEIIEQEEESQIEINNFQEEGFTDFDDGWYEELFEDFSGISDGFIEDAIEWVNQDNADILPEDLEALQNQEDGVEINSVYPTTDVRPDTIRYVRDWLSGSDSNGWNFWVEIQALERNTLINKAEWKEVIWTRTESDTRPYSKITDGSIDTYDYAYGWWSLQNVMIDLWTNYDIGMVNVWHYYGNARTFNKTKTEVSEDGETWYILHDAEVDGKYVETGSWRSYGLEEIITTVPSEIRYIRDYLNRSNRNWGNHWLEIEAIERGTQNNIAQWKPVIGILPARYETRPFSRITDGSKVSSEYAEWQPYRKVWVMVDLEWLYEIDMVKVWHYHYDGWSGRIYNDTKTEVSADGVHWYVLHDSEADGTYIEPKDASGRTYELRNTITEKPAQIRYIRDHANGSNKNGWSHWIELQAYDENGTNVAAWKAVTWKYPQRETIRPYSRLTDTDLTYYARTSGQRADNWMQVDLWQTYNIEMLKVWHYYKDNRSYKETKTEISADGIHWYVLHDAEVDGRYTEPVDGTGKIYRLTDEPIQKTCITNVWADCHFTFHHASSFDFDIGDDSKVSVISSSGSFKLEWLTEWKTKVRVSKDGVTYYEVDIQVMPAHTSHDMTMEIWQTQIIQVPDADRYEFSVSNGWLISYKWNSREIHITSTTQAWNTKLYMKYKWLLMHTMDITIEPAATEDLSGIVEESFSIPRWSAAWWKSWYMVFDASTVSKLWMISLQDGRDHIAIRWLQEWNVKLYVRAYDHSIQSMKVTKVLNVEITPPTYTETIRCNISPWGYCDIKLSNPNDYSYTVTNLGIISYAKNSSLLRITGERVGNTDLYIKKNGTTLYKVEVKVREIITKTYDIDLYEWQEAKLYLHNAYLQNYTITKKWIAWLYATAENRQEDTLYLKWYEPWTTQIYIWANIALNITIHDKPKEYECTVEMWMVCYLNFYKDYKFHDKVRFEVANRDVIWLSWFPVDGRDRATIVPYKEWIGHFSVTWLTDEIQHLKVNVVPRNTTNVEESCELDIGENCRILLRDTWDYEVTVSNAGIVSANRTNNEYNIYGNKGWATYVYIKKDGKIVHTIYVEVSDVQNLTLWSFQINLETWEEDYFLITSWNWDYRIYADNKNVSIYATGEENKYRVYANGGWRTTVRVYDKENRFGTLIVDVAWPPIEEDLEEDLQDDAQFSSFILLDDESQEEAQNIAAFNVTWEYTEVGIEYRDASWNMVREQIDYNEDWFYIVQADVDICESCHLEFQPYIKDASWNTIYPAWIWNYQSLWWDETFKNIAIANWVGVASNEEYIEVANLKRAWESIQIGTTDVVTTIMLNFTGIAWEWAHLEISSSMLATFMSWDGSEQFYWNNHWITQEVKKTSWYRDRKSQFMQLYPNQGSQLHENKIWVFIEDKWSYIRDIDLQYSFWRVTWNMNPVITNDGVYMKILINDTYDFHRTSSNWSSVWWVLKDTLNAWWHYYNLRWYWKEYEWKTEIIEKIY